MDSKLISLTYEACDAFKKRADYKRLLQLKKQIEDDLEAQGLISTFLRAKQRYEEAKAYGKYHPDLGKYQKEFQEQKVRLMENPYIKEYKDLERALQKVLDRFSIDLARVVSPNVKHPREMNILNLEER